MNRGSWVLALAAGLVAAAACGTSAAKVEVIGALPLEMPYREARDGVVILRGRVNGLDEADFILDTGAKSSLCNERVEEIRFAGLAAPDLFRNFVIEVDPAGQRVRFHDPRTWRVADGAATALLAPRKGHQPVRVGVKLASGETVTQELDFDIGRYQACYALR